MQEYALTEQIMSAGIPPPEGSDNAELLTMSTLNEEGVMNVKQVACDRLLSSRVETKLQVHARSALYVAPPAPPPSCSQHTLHNSWLLLASYMLAKHIALLCDHLSWCHHDPGLVQI